MTDQTSKTVMNGDHLQYEIDNVNVPPEQRPDWPLPSFDARDWAKEFCRIAKVTGHELDEEWMVGWFANALMRGFDEANARRHVETADDIGSLFEAWYKPAAWRRGPAPDAREGFEAGYAAALQHTLPDQLLDVHAICDERDRLRAELNALQVKSAEETTEQPWVAAADRLLEKIAYVPGIEAERRALIAAMPSPEETTALSRAIGNSCEECGWIAGTHRPNCSRNTDPLALSRWVCPNCETVNDNDDEQCRVCPTARPETTNGNQAAPASSGAGGDTPMPRGNLPNSLGDSELPVMRDRIQGVDCYWCEDGTPHRHETATGDQS